MTGNKKVRNASAHDYNGITFKSGLELAIFQALEGEKIHTEYEQHSYDVMEGFSSYVPIFSDCNKKKNTKRASGKFKPIIYTPDFVVPLEHTTIIIEAKGFPSRDYPLRKKLFVNLLNKFQEVNPSMRYAFFEISSRKNIPALVETIKKIKENERT